MMTSSRMRSVSGSVAVTSLVDRLDERLGAEHFAGVQAAVDPDDRLPFLGELSRFLGRHAFGAGQLRGDLAVSVELREVGRRRDDRHELIAAFLGLADIDDLQSVGLAFELLRK